MRRLPALLILLMLIAERPGDGMYWGHWRSPLIVVGLTFFQALPGLRFQLWELLLYGATALALVLPGGLTRRAGPVDKAILLFLGTVAFTVLWGVARGGSLREAYFQLRMPLMALTLGLLLLGTLRTHQDVARLGKTLVLAACIRGFLASYFFFVYVQPNPGLTPYPQHMTTHDDSVLFVCGVVIMLSYLMMQRTWKVALLTAVVGLHLFVAIHVNNRRLAWISLIGALAFMYLGLPKGLVKRRINLTVPIVVPLLALYVAVGWGRNGRIFAPVRTFSSIMGKNEDHSSKARNEENRNLVTTLRASPVTGTGWGHQYIEASNVYSPDLAKAFPQYRYIPHNSLLGLITFSGAIGLTGLGSIFTVCAFLGARMLRAGQHPVERAAGMTILAMMVVYLNQAFGDMGLQSPAPTMILGACIGVAGRAAVMSEAWPTRRRRAVARARATQPAALPATQLAQVAGGQGRAAQAPLGGTQAPAPAPRRARRR